MFIYAQSHPGKRIEELMVTHGFHTQIQLAEALDIKQARCSKIISGKLPINPELALSLERVFPEHSAHEWLDIQVAYELHEEAKRQGLFNSVFRTPHRGVTRTIVMAH